jgi:predicted SAM-dependent methyltransferase
MTILSGFRHRLERHYADYKMYLAIKQLAEIRIILGAGGTVCEGFVSTDYPQLDICSKASFEKYLRPETVGVFVAEHVLEHLSLEEGAVAFGNCFLFLKPGGLLRIAVPDGFHPDPEYIDRVRPGGCGAGADGHKVIYNYRTLSSLLENAGYKVRLLEWFDEEGQFQYEKWGIELGLIRRSARFDERNKVNPLTYTSLIIDAIKP